MHGFDTISGNQAVKDSLRAALHSRFPQAVLLTGPAGSGKLELARMLAAALLCTGPGERPCGACPSCRKIQNDTHPDLDVIDRGEEELPVALARELRQKVCVMPNDGDRRVVILRHAHKLNTAAQNALLKVLEEPPRYAFFLLTSEQPGAVLETIRSRCTRYQLEPQETPGTDTETLLPLAAPILHALAEADEYRLLIAAMGLEKQPRPTFRAVLGLLQSALRDAIFSANGLPGRILPALSADSERLAARVDPQRLIRLYDFLSTLSARTEINAAAPIQCAGLCAGAYQICYL